MLSKRTKYGFKALTHLARAGKGVIISTTEISEKQLIPRKFLESILFDLQNSGILKSKLGKKGGHYLVKSPEEIRLAQVFRVLEGPIALLPCVSLNYYERCNDCPDETACTLHKVMIDIRDNTLRVLENKTLADLI